jgi:hypothetical protein
VRREEPPRQVPIRGADAQVLADERAALGQDGQRGEAVVQQGEERASEVAAVFGEMAPERRSQRMTGSGARAASSRSIC